jgi:hypothetical protein
MHPSLAGRSSPVNPSEPRSEIAGKLYLAEVLVAFARTGEAKLSRSYTIHINHITTHLVLAYDVFPTDPA